jgi:hypothetical protein
MAAREKTPEPLTVNLGRWYSGESVGRGMRPGEVINFNLSDSISLGRLAGFEVAAGQAGLSRRIAEIVIRGFHKESSLTDFAAKLTSLAEHAYSARQLEIVGYAGHLLSQLPISRQTESAGIFYQALNLNRGGRGDTVRAECLLETVTGGASLKYVARAMVALGNNAVAVADYQTALARYRETLAILTRDRIFDPLTFYMARRMSVLVKGMTGDHRGAVADLEAIFPLARLASSQQPYAYYDYMNTLAVELTEVGRLEQAGTLSGVTLASPFASAYPEWQATFDEIRLKQRRSSRSVVSVPGHIGGSPELRSYGGASHNLMNFPANETVNAVAASQRPFESPGRVLNFQEWKTALGRSGTITTDLAPEVRRRMTPGEKLIRLMDLISQDDTDDEMVDRILEAVEQIVLSRRTNNPN